MADQVFYTHHVGFKGSEALEEAYYSDVTHRLYIKFVNGNTAGYVNVPKEHFKALAAAQSAGSYYNTWIKYSFTGTHTDVVFVPESDRNASSSVAPDPNVDKTGNAAKSNFVVVVRVDGTLEFTVPAVDVRSALQNVEQILANSSRSNDLTYTFEGVNKS
jgi:hypothetical protein